MEKQRNKKTDLSNDTLDAQMKNGHRIPVTLKHKPVIVVENYQNIDGREAYKSDARGLSLGLAQWNDRGRVDISAKVWRYTGEKWSRQSEEMPLYRALDLALITCEGIKHFREAYRYPKGYDPSAPSVDTLALQGDKMEVSVCTDNPCIDEDIKLFESALKKDDELLSERMAALSRLLKELGY